MKKQCFNVLLIEDDHFASNMIMMLLAKDFRTHVIGELSNHIDSEIFNSLTQLRKAKKESGGGYLNANPKHPIDVVILDTEVPWNKDIPSKVMENFSKWASPPKILCTCTYPDEKTLKSLSKFECFSGYIVKSDVLYCIASAVCLAGTGYTVISPQICPLLEEGDITNLRGETLIISYPKQEKKIRINGNLSADIIRLKLIFNLPQSEIQEELFTSEKYARQVITKKYSNLHMSDIVFERIKLDELLSNPYINNRKIIEHYGRIIPNVLAKRSSKKRNPKFRNMDTLAFHLMTIPDIKKW